ncbi:restriction endonuclease subunit S [Geoalkalibacter halelectricus]|uniref:Restriction endonuclease subunit S n=1 Tax=Geoalkalibacter halelectricus TaxID=2847045 RepID=A0ABY5ZPC4_9BACT|nr:restriction endonuclease subunit S [Geoalkalibacter halelectricus]MDO3377195.1 restriction endonuclease subunit S [Geoalkalibacter halelectricus]UWZ79735.1 restriction endonuclease subunit S [Geoalkalibacter halelectricus]
MNTNQNLCPIIWKIQELSHLCELITDGSHFSPVPQADGEIIANVKDMTEWGINYNSCTRISTAEFDFLCRQNCSPKHNDVLLSKDGTIGRVVVYRDHRKIVLLSSIAILRTNGKIDPDYLYTILRSDIFNRQLYQLQSGSALKRLVLKDINKLKIPCPTLPEQRKIARILSTVNSVIEKTEASIAKYKAIKQGMMLDLFTRGLDANGRLRPRHEDAPHLYKQTELGLVPKEWEVARIGDFANVKGGKRLPAGQDFADVMTPFPYLRVTDMVDGTIDQRDLKYVPENIEPLIRAYKISKNDVYVTIAGTLGLFGTVPDNLDNAQLTENAAKITDFNSKDYNRDYIKYQCNSEVIQSGSSLFQVG